MLLESVRSALERRGYDVTASEPTSNTLDPRDRWRPPDVVARGEDDLACWVVDQVQPSTVIRAQAAARGLEARPLVVGEAVDDGAQPWARRYDVEVLDPDALAGLAADGSNGSRGLDGSNGAVDDAADPEPEAADDGEPVPSRPALGAAPPAGDPAPASPVSEATGEPGDDGDEPAAGPVDVLSLLDVPRASEGQGAGAPPTWLAPRPVPWETRPSGSRDDAGDEASGACEAGPPGPGLAGAPPGPATRAASPKDDGTDSIGRPADPEDGPEAAADPAPGVGDPSGSLPWDPAEADPPDPPTNGHSDGVNPPGTPLASANGNNGSARPARETREPQADPEPPAIEARAEPAAPAAGPAPADEPEPAADGGPGTTSLDALVEAAAQSPQPTPGAPAASGARDPSPDPARDEAGPDLEPETLGDDGPAASASTDPRKIAEDVMREREDEAREPDEPDHTSPNPAKTGSELLNAGGASDPEPTEATRENGAGEPAADGRPRQDEDAEPELDETPWQDDDPTPDGTARQGGDDGISGPGPAGKLPRENGAGGADGEPAAPDPAGDELRPAEAGDPVGADDAAMRRHEPDLWNAGGRLDDVRTSLRDAGDSFHARARPKADDSGWLDDLDGDA